MSKGILQIGFLPVWMAIFDVAIPLGAVKGDDPSYYMKKQTWQETLLASRDLLMKQDQESGRGAPLPNFGKSDFSVAAWIKTKSSGGAIVAKAPAEGEWAPQGKVLFLRGGALAFDVGWVGVVGSDRPVNDGVWHHVVLTGRNPIEFFVDGSLVKRGSLELQSDPPENAFKIGYCSTNFPGPSGFEGLIDEVRIYNRRLSAEEIGRIRNSQDGQDNGLLGFWRFEGDAEDSSGNKNHGNLLGAKRSEGKFGKALRFERKDMVLLPSSRLEAAKNELWELLARDFQSPLYQKEMLQERQDKIWDRDWPAGEVQELARRYAEACSDDEQREKAARLAEEARSEKDLWEVRKIYHTPPPLRFPEPSPLDEDPHLLGLWRFDQETGTEATDTSKNGRHGKLSGGLSFQKDGERGRYGLALKFDRSGSVEIPGFKGISGTRPRTVVAWIKTKTARGEIVSWGEEDFGKMWIFGFVRGHVGVTPQGGYLYMNDSLHDDTWHQVAVVVEEAEIPNLHDHVKLYKDSEPAEIHDIGLLDLWPIDTGSDLDLRIGRGFQGLIDDVRIYDRVLSEEEILQLYQVKGRPKL